MKINILYLIILVALSGSCGNNAETPVAENSPADSSDMAASKEKIPNDTAIEIPAITEATTQPVKVGQEKKIKTPTLVTNSEIVTLKKAPEQVTLSASSNTPDSSVDKKTEPQSPQNKPETPASKPVPIPQSSSSSIAGPPPHDAFDKILSQYVSTDGSVNYKGLKSAKTALKAYTDLLSKNPVQESWSRNEKLAYWLNAYNAFTLTLIVDNYPITSITKLDGGKPWDVKRITLGDKKYSLNDIENNIIRPQFKEPRIHFAVNCAARSCPPLLNHAWTAANLNSYFEQQAKKFINDTRFNILKPNEVKISRIFDWYAADFGNIITFLNKYATTKINEKAKISYLEYNWSLNE
jgi:hypothetical protein